MLNERSICQIGSEVDIMSFGGHQTVLINVIDLVSMGPTDRYHPKVLRNILQIINTNIF